VSETNRAILLTWNPEKYNKGGSGTQDFSSGLHAGARERWNCNTTKANIGDRVYLIRLGIEPRGIVASGAITKEPFVDEDWADANKQRRYIEFQVDDVRESCVDGLLPMALLTAALPTQHWSTQTSGISIGEDMLPTLERLWHEGNKKHSLCQFADWHAEHNKQRTDKWRQSYRAVTDLARDIRAQKRAIDAEALRILWKEVSNGLASVAPGAMSGDDFDSNKRLLTSLTEMICTKPDADTMQRVLDKWNAAKEQGKISKIYRSVIRRVFAAAAPDRYTTIVNPKQCRELLNVLHVQFQLLPEKALADDWVSLSDDISACMRQAGLNPTQVLQNNIAMWRLVADAGAQVPDDATQDVDNETNNAVQAKPMTNSPLNQILYGPPGTGKTFATIDKALEILDPVFLAENCSNREALKTRFDQLANISQVRFVTFHQSFSYEDFVEGIRAETGDDQQLRYEVVDGIFKSLCESAISTVTQQDTAPIDIGNRRIWKMSIGNSQKDDDYLYDECIENGYTLLGWGNTIDFSGCSTREQIVERFAKHNKPASAEEYRVTAVMTFVNQVKRGDLMVITDGNLKFRAIGEVTGDYKLLPRTEQADGYHQSRAIKWLRVYSPSKPHDQLTKKRFMQKTLYELKPNTIDRALLGVLLKPESTSANNSAETTQSKVLIIDEINRGNISRIFGELITLIEPSKRAGADEALEITLPYSKEKFSVPQNVYLIGTMNTADRSLASLDIALRRRFTFVEMPPQPALLNDINIEGVNIGQLLRVMNERIELLLDRDHCLGHAYFMPLEADASLAKLAFIFSQQIVPLLQEYFFEDWERIAWVLNDQNKTDKTQRFVQKIEANLAALFGADTASNLQNTDRRFCINKDAFSNIASYRGILGNGGATGADA